MRILKVRGNSMSPRYGEGDFLLVCRYGARLPRPGDDVVFEHRDLGLLVKRVRHVEDGRLHVGGLNSMSTATGALGTLDLQSCREIERVVFHVAGPAAGP